MDPSLWLLQNPVPSQSLFSLPLRKMSKREIAAAAAKKYVLSLNNATANPPADRYHSVITLITLGKAEEGENINREKFSSDALSTRSRNAAALATIAPSTT